MEGNYVLHNALKRFAGGDEIRAYAYMGCHEELRLDRQGYVFRLWAPKAQSVSLVGDWNGWDPQAEPMTYMEYGVWEVFSTEPKLGQAYKFRVLGQDGVARYKTDPFAFSLCPQPENSSRIASGESYCWGDEAYRRQQGKRKLLDSALNIYELHPPSWRKHPDGSCLSYKELEAELIPYVKDMGYTHIELLAPWEPARDGSGLALGFYAPGNCGYDPRELMSFIDHCHREGVGVLIEWNPYAFPKEEQGLYDFDGSCCYELADPLMNEPAGGAARLFDFAKGEVQSFLISNAVYWMEQYHADGLRVSDVTAMLYLDYDRQEYHPNAYGGKENLDAISFLRKLNRAVFSVRRNAITVAEEYTAFPLVTKPDYDGGLGFLYKWNMGWLQNMVEYFRLDPLWRKGSHRRLTAAMEYAYAENFILALPEEPAHGEGRMISMLPGEHEDRFADLRAFYGFMMAFPGKKQSFMGNEFADYMPREPDWITAGEGRHRQFADYVRELNRLYVKDSCLWNNDTDNGGFSWICMDDCDNSVLAFRRIDRRNREIIAVCNFCPVVREHYCLGLPRGGEYQAVLSSDEERFGGTAMELPPITAEKKPFHGLPYSGEFTLPPLSATYYKRIVNSRKADGETNSEISDL